MAVINAPTSEYWRRLLGSDDMLNFSREIYKSGIARRLIVYVVLFSSFITLLATAAQLYRDYNTDITLIQRQVKQIQDVHLKSLTAALWASDTRELSTRLEGISQLRDMQFLEVRDQDKVWVSLGTRQSRNIMSHQYPLIYTHRGRGIEIGTLTVVASLAGVYQRLVDKVWVILVSNGIKTFLVAGFILVIFHTLITRHLVRIADFAHTLDINKLDKRLGLDRKGYRKQKIDELDLVVNAINQMQVNIKESFTALEQSEEHFQVLATVSPVGIFNTDAQGNCTYVNKRWCELAGRSEEEAFGEGWARALHPEDRDRVFAEWYQATADEIPFKTECRFQRPDGAITWLLALAEAELDAQGEVVGYVGTITDINERRRTEETVRNISAGVSAQTGEVFFRHLVEHLSRIFGTDYAFIGALATDNPQQIDTLAVYAHGKIVDNMTYFLAGTPCANVMGESTCAYPSGVQQQFPEDRMLAELEVEGYIGTPLFDNRGEPLGILVVQDRKPLQDIGQMGELLEIFAARAAAEIERLRAEEVLARSQAEFEAMFNAISDAVVFADTQRRIVLNNPAVHKMFGYGDEELVGQTTEMLYADPQDFIDQGKRRFRVGPVAEKGVYEVRYKRKDGSIFWSETLGTQVKDTNGHTIGFLALFRDITERVNIEKELEQHRNHLEELVSERTHELRETQEELVRKERLATLGQLTATVSHELRNPLGAMRPSLYVIQHEAPKDDERLQNAIARLDRSIQRCDHIIDELLDFTRITQLEAEPGRLDDWLETVLDEQEIPEPVVVSKKPGLNNRIVTFDPNRLRRAVINVMDNACQAMISDDPENKQSEESLLKIITRESGDRVEIVISDTGPGMPEEVMQKIYEPLFSTKAFGVGLGMPTVKQIMQQHGGGVEINTEAGRGTEVVLWLPGDLSIKQDSVA